MRQAQISCAPSPLNGPLNRQCGDCTHATSFQCWSMLVAGPHLANEGVPCGSAPVLTHAAMVTHVLWRPVPLDCHICQTLHRWLAATGAASQSSGGAGVAPTGGSSHLDIRKRSQRLHASAALARHCCPPHAAEQPGWHPLAQQHPGDSELCAVCGA